MVKTNAVKRRGNSGKPNRPHDVALPSKPTPPLALPLPEPVLRYANEMRALQTDAGNAFQRQWSAIATQWLEEKTPADALAGIADPTRFDANAGWQQSRMMVAWINRVNIEIAQQTINDWASYWQQASQACLNAVTTPAPYDADAASMPLARPPLIEALWRWSQWPTHWVDFAHPQLP